MKTIQNKTKLMKKIEKEQNINVEELLRIKYVDENKSLEVISDEIGISYATIVVWLKLSGIYSRKLGLDV